MHLARIANIVALTATVLLAVCAQAQSKYKETVLYNFNYSSYGSYPFTGLTMDQSGNLYGVGGAFFELSPNGSGGWKYTDLLNGFAYANSPLVMDPSGNFYTSSYFGDVWEFSPDGSGGWTSSPIYTFNGGAGDGGPSSLVIDGAGNLYGIVSAGGSYGLGYVFELSPISGGGWSMTDLYDFRGKNGAGGAGAAGVVGGLIMDAAGNLYGTTMYGGFSTNCSSGCGVVFKLTNNSGVWTETLLYSFDGWWGANPDATLLMDADGNLYGTTIAGGFVFGNLSGFGTVFEMSPVPTESSVFQSGKWRIRNLYAFTDLNLDGAYPQAALIMDAAGNLYGTTTSGGYNHCSVPPANGCGTVFELLHRGPDWEEAILHAFTGGADGGFPAGLVSDASGNLYSTAMVGGVNSLGLVFELSPLP